MDLSQDPCTDFYAYACGSWSRAHHKPAGLRHWTNFVRLERQIADIIRRGLDGRGRHRYESPVERRARAHYDLCLRRNAVSLADSRAELHAIFASVKFRLSEKKAKQDLSQLLAVLSSQFGVQPFFTWTVGVNDQDSSQHILRVDQPRLTLGGRHFYSDSAIEKSGGALLDFIKEMMELVDGDKDALAKPDILLLQQNLLQLERELALAEPLPAEHRKLVHAPNYVTLRDLQQNLTFLDWYAFAAATVQSEEGETLGKGEEIILTAPSYLKKLSARLTDLLATAEGRRLVSVFTFWRLYESLADYLAPDFRAAKQRLQEKLADAKPRPVKKVSWRTCLKETETVFKNVLGRIYIQETANLTTTDPVAEVEMILKAVKSTVVASFRDNPWMDEKTRKAAIRKSKKIKGLVGFPSYIMNEEKLKRMYESVKMRNGSFLGTKLEQMREKQRPERLWERLQKEVASTGWLTPPQKMNAFYTPVMNEIMIPLGILQPPFFDTDRPEVLNYAAIGFTIGHELTHAFDDNGRKYDGEGNLSDWWGEEAVQGFQERAQCLVDQFGNFSLYNQTVNGRNTLGETIADNGGIHAAWKAYFGNRPEAVSQVPLPDLKMRADQLFFLAFAQVWCSDNARDYEIDKIAEDPHPPSIFRVQAAVANSPDFAAAFSCPQTAPLNPARRCSIW